MRYSDINLAEASVENIRVLKQLANAIWSSLPEVPEGTVKDVYLSQLSGFNRIHKAYEDHSKFAKPFHVMETTMLRLVNDENYNDPHYGTRQDVAGYHSGGENLMLIWISNIRKQTYAVKFSARTIMVHELRHLFQNALYPNYFNSRKAFANPYEKQQIEIDAVWSQILGSEIDAEDYREHPSAFVQDVMIRLLGNKQLSNAEIKHYRRKTLKYFRQLFDEDTETEWRRLIAIWGNEVKSYADYSVKNFVADVMQELGNYLRYKVKNPKIEQQIMDHYRAETRKEYKRLSVGTRQERRKTSIINSIIPLWTTVAEELRDQWFDPKVNSLRLMNTVVQRLDSPIRRATNPDKNPDLYKEIMVWFARLTRERIQSSREWQQRAAADQKPTKN